MSKHRNILAAALVAMPLGVIAVSAAQAEGYRGYSGQNLYGGRHVERQAPFVVRPIWNNHRFERRHFNPWRFSFLRHGHGGGHY